MSDSTLTGNAPVRQNITRKNVIIGLLLLLFVLIALWCHGRPGSELGLLGFTPLVALAILSLIGVDIVLAVISSIIIAMIMTSTGLPEMGTMLAKSTGSFIATVGLIIMLGAGVGEVATRTGAAVELVKFVVHRIGLSSQTRVKFGIVASSILICGSLGTMAGGNAIIVAVIIPVAAAVRLTPPTVAALMMTAGFRWAVYRAFHPQHRDDPQPRWVELSGLSAVRWSADERGHAAGRLGNGGTDPEDDRRQTAL